MHRAQPVSNKICSKKWQERDYNLHQTRLKNMKSSIDNAAPQPMPHLRNKSKKVVTEQGTRRDAKSNKPGSAPSSSFACAVSDFCFGNRTERFDEIRRENMILLNKMTDIMQGRNGIDNDNKNIKFVHSLNKGYRKREFQKITSENQAILKRIQARQPVYNHLKVRPNALRSDDLHDRNDLTRHLSSFASL